MIIGKILFKIKFTAEYKCASQEFVVTKYFPFDSKVTIVFLSDMHISII